jgi:hypothetical protein
MKLKDIKPNPRNPRKIGATELDRLVKSIERDPEFMALRPIVVDDDMVVLGGNQRLKAIKKLGMKEIPESWVVKASNLTEEQRKRFVVLDNVSAGAWDVEMLELEFKELDFKEMNLDLDTLKGHGTIFKAFNENVCDSENDADNKNVGSDNMDKVPVTFILEKNDFQKWESVKNKMKIQGDKTCFLKIIEEVLKC